MPEGPEVRTMTDNVANFITGGTLISVTLRVPEFGKKTKGLDLLEKDLPLGVTAVESKGKFCYITLSNGRAIGVTFGMSGNIRVDPDEAELARRKETRDKYLKHAAVAFEYLDSAGDGPYVFYYHDTRRFGSVHYMTDRELKTKLNALGPSIMDTEPLTLDALVKRWRRHNGKDVCTVLMNQDLVSGIGNYLKSTILYECRVYPMALLKDLDDQTLYAMYECARSWAQRAYDAGGASLYTYTGLHGDRSDVKTELPTYDKAYDPDGRRVLKTDTPDKRTTHWVVEVQTKGAPEVDDVEDIPVVVPKGPVLMRPKKVQVKLRPKLPVKDRLVL